MIGAALLISLAMQPAAAVPGAAPTATADEILVIGERLKDWKGRLSPAGQALRCVTIKTSGDQEVDQIGCGAMVTCFTRDRARLTAEASRRRRAAEQSPAFRAMGLCVRDYYEVATAALAERRYQARQGR